VEEKPGDLGFNEDDLMANIGAVLHRLEQLEQTAAIFKKAD